MLDIFARRPIWRGTLRASFLEKTAPVPKTRHPALELVLVARKEAPGGPHCAKGVDNPVTFKSSDQPLVS